jgi:hypothetical protein
MTTALGDIIAGLLDKGLDRPGTAMVADPSKKGAHFAPAEGEPS